MEPGSQYLQLDGKNDEQANIGVDGLYFFNRNPDFAPCALAGLTYAAERYFDTDKNNNLMVRVGLGFTKQLTRNVAFRSDLRYQYPSNKAGSGSLGDWVTGSCGRPEHCVWRHTTSRSACVRGSCLCGTGTGLCDTSARSATSALRST